MPIDGHIIKFYRQLRGNDFSRAPVGLAEVQLILNNEDGLLPVPFKEVVIARRADRAGENEYLLNRSRIRLRDLLELLAHAGLGPDGHALIAQGFADQALNLRPEQRREVFEDASGVRQYRLQRTEAEHKVAEAFGAWGEKVLYGKRSIGMIRKTFVIGMDGKIEYANHKVKAEGHGEKILDVLKG